MKKTLLTLLVLSFSRLAFPQGSWSSRATFPDIARSDNISFSIGKYGYMGLGLNQSFPLAIYHDLWQFNPSTNTWTQKASFPGVIRFDAATFVIGHKAYVVTGEDSNYICLSDCWVYDADADTWTQKKNFPGHERCAAVGFAIGNKGFLATGVDSVYYNDVWEYDTASDTWAQKANFSGAPRAAANGFAIGTKAYICFGAIDFINAGIFTNDMWEYDTASDTWTQKVTYPGGISLQCTSGFVIGNNIYIGTGQDSTAKCYQWFWRYNTTNDTWTKQANFPGTPRNNPSAFAIGDTGYMGSGLDQSPFFFKDFYKFYPDTLTGINTMESSSGNITIYPNPNNGVFTLSCYCESGKESNPILEIFNGIGQKIYDATLKQVQGNNFIDLSGKPSGVYLYRVTNREGNIVASGKFIVQ